MPGDGGLKAIEDAPGSYVKAMGAGAGSAEVKDAPGKTNAAGK